MTIHREIDLEEIDSIRHTVAETGFGPHAGTFTLRSASELIQALDVTEALTVNHLESGCTHDR
jgi:hypothetical protein